MKIRKRIMKAVGLQTYERSVAEPEFTTKDRRGVHSPIEVNGNTRNLKTSQTQGKRSGVKGGWLYGSGLIGYF